MSQRTIIDNSLIMHFEDSIKQGPPLDFERQEDEKKNGVFLGRKSCSKSQSENP